MREAIRRAAKEELALLELDIKGLKERAILDAAANRLQEPEELRIAVQKLERAAKLLQDAGIQVCESPAEIGETVESILG